MQAAAAQKQQHRQQHPFHLSPHRAQHKQPQLHRQRQPEGKAGGLLPAGAAAAEGRICIQPAHQFIQPAAQCRCQLLQGGKIRLGAVLLPAAHRLPGHKQLICQLLLAQPRRPAQSRQPAAEILPVFHLFRMLFFHRAFPAFPPVFCP